MSLPEINSRSWQLLKLLIQRYIQDGEPVASKTLAQDLHLSLSPATIRNVMSELEQAGYIYSPHTSSGRIPTEQGYRLFVDELLTSQSSEALDLDELKEQINSQHDTNSLVQTTSSLLSDITKLAGIVTVPKCNQNNLRHIEFLPLSKRQVLAILVFNEKEVQNRVIEVDRDYSQSELQQVSNYLNQKYMGKMLLDIHKDLLSSLHQTHQNMNSLMQIALDMAHKVFKTESEKEDYFMSGHSNLLQPEAAVSFDRLRTLFDEFTKKQSILYLLDQCLNADGVQIFIGKEAGQDVFDDFSIVARPYEVDGEVLGVLGVIGPIRMAYDKVISVVDLTARLLGDALLKS